jgi:hypothetical protein
VNDDEAWLPLPHDADTARTLLEFADEHGYPVESIRTSEDGYFVPAPMAELLYPTTPTPQEA